jgi:hypothetical protein
MSRFRAEAPQPVVHQDAGAGDHEAAAPGRENALNQGDPKLAVAYDELGGVAFDEGGARLAGALHVDVGGSAARVLLREQLVDRHRLDDLRVGDVTAGVGEGDLRCLNQHVHRISVHEPPAGDRELLGDVQGLEENDALRRHGLLIHVHTVVGRQ